MPQHDAFFDTLEMDLQLQQRVQDEQLEEELLERVGAFTEGGRVLRGPFLP